MRTQADDGTQAVRRCQHCAITKTTQWRQGPMGPKTLCNACGVRYNSGRLLPEYRPAASPTFVPYLHSNHHRKVIEMRNELVQLTSTNPPSHKNHLVDLSGSSSESEGIPESEKGKKIHKLQAIEEKLKPMIPLGPIVVKKNNNGAEVKRCQQCMIAKTLHWRGGKTLCNACWVHYDSQRLFSEHRPAASSTFAPNLHSNSHRKVIETKTKRLHPATFSPRASAQLTSPNPAFHENHLIVLSGSSSESECVKVTENGKKCHEPQAIEEKTLTPKISLSSMDEQTNNNGTQEVMICQHCATTKTTLWMNGPMGPKTLCNACGLRYRSGKLLPEYRPTASPTFVPSLHSNSHREVVEIRNKLVEEKSVDVTKRSRTKRLHPGASSIRTSIQLTSADPPCHKNYLGSLSGSSSESEVKMSENGKECHEPQEQMTTLKIPLGQMDEQKNNWTQAVKICQHCATTKTTLWMNGPMGPKTLCNACGVRYRSGKLLPEYCPAARPTFVPSLHSNSHREVVEIGNKLIEEKSVDVTKRSRTKRPRPGVSSRRTSIQLTSANLPCHKNYLGALSGSSSESEVVKESKNGKKCHELQAIEKKMTTSKIPLGPMDEQKNNNATRAVIMCQHCAITKTTQWRQGPMGPRTLCNACGVRYRSGRLLPEYRPAASPTFDPSLHSSSHRKVIKIRKKAC